MRPVRFSSSLARWAGVALFTVGPLIAGAAALSPSSEVDGRAAIGLVVAFLALAAITAVAPASTWWIVALPVIAMALTGLEVAVGAVDEAHRVALLPLLYAATFLRLRPALPTFAGFVLVTVAIISEQDASLGVVLVDALLQVGLALAISAGAETVDRRAAADRARAALAAAVTAEDVVRCLEEHVIGGGIVAAALAIVDGEPPTLAEWVADAGVGASFEPGRTIRVGPRDLISQVAFAGAVEVDVAGDSGAAAELRGRGYASALAVGIPGPGGLVGALVLGGRRATSFRGRRRNRLERTARPLADAVTAMIQRREHESRAQFGLAARDVTTGIVAARDPEALWDAILGGLRRMLGADRAWIARRSETDPAVIVAAAAHGAPRDAFRIDTTYETSLTVVALASGKPEWVPDIPSSDAAHRGIVSDFPVEAALFLPMADSSGAHGLVVLHFDRPRLLRAHERDIAAALAREAGLAFSRLDAERRLRQQATRDALTGLLNHGAFHGAAVDTIARLGGKNPVALVLCDLDHLKYLNDAYGHAAGDDALRAVARVLESCARRDDVLGRLGGDEFGWLLPGATPDDAVAAAERALRMAAAVDTAAGDGVLSLTAGIAVALTAVDGETLFERADGALREGKLAGRGVARLVGADRPRRQRPAPEEQRPQELLTTAAESVPELAELAVVEWSAVFRASACALSLIDGDVLRTIAFCAGLHPQPVTVEPYVIAEYPETAAALELRRTRQIRADDLDADPAELEVMQRNDARTLLIVPLVVGDTVKGLVELYDSRPRIFSTDEQRLALALGRYLAATLERLAAT